MMDIKHFAASLLCFISIISNKKNFSYAHLRINRNSSEENVDAGNNVQFQCRGEEPVVWIPPNNVMPNNMQIRNTFTNSSAEEKYLPKHVTEFTIYKATVANVGYYTCLCKKYINRIEKIYHSKSIYLYVLDKETLIVPSNPVIKIRDTTSPLIPCRPTAPNVDISIYKGNVKIDVNKNGYYNRQEGLRIKINPTEDNFKINCSAKLDDTIQSVIFNVYLKEKPSVKLSSNNFYIHGEITNFTCVAEGIPLPKITWHFKNCIGHDVCKFTLPEEINVNTLEKRYTDNVTSTLNIKAEVSGNVMCVAKNINGIAKSSSELYITDVKNGFDIIGDNEIALVGDNVTLKCVISHFYNFTDAVHWFKMPENTLIEESNEDGYFLQESRTELSKELYLHIPNINISHRSYYACIGEYGNKILLKKDFYINVTSNASLEVESNMNNSDAEYFLGEQNVTLFCNVIKGHPIPIVKWYKNDHEPLSNDINEDRIHLSDDGAKLYFKYIKPEDTGKYVCSAKNKFEHVSKYIELKLKEPSNSTSVIILIGIIFICAIGVVIGLLILKIKRDKELKAYLSNLGFNYFEEGAIASINPDLGIDEQAEFLPYDKKWEFPRENLTIGKHLGSGAFGIVLKGIAKGIINTEESTKVAVKTVKTSADPIFVKNLVSELKILIHLGQHVNIVNLLGACTMNIVNRDFFVIVEYCRYGNLNNYLRRRRNIFIDQIDPTTGVIDFKIGYEPMDKSTNNDNGENSQTIDGNINENHINIDDHNIRSGLTNRPLTITGGKQPEWRFNFRADYNYKESVQLLSTKDLVCWSFQIALGLEFLASRKIIHGDLATRNILLSDNNIIKICDFGLAKRMFKSYYKKKSEGPLPIKWMAIESIKDRIFSIQSDVWAYGIVLWELFSLARVPYPELEADEKFLKKLYDGHRMEKPQYANDKLYGIMLECWHANPLHRPTLTDLIKKFGDILDDATRDHFINLNGPYLLMNKKQMAEHDYLANMSSPDYSNYASMSATQDYVNAPNGGSFIVNPLSPEYVDADGYLRVSGKDNSNLKNIPQISVTNPLYGQNLNTEDDLNFDSIPIEDISHDSSPNNNVVDGYSYPKPIVNKDSSI